MSSGSKQHSVALASAQFEIVEEPRIFRDHTGHLVQNGVMDVPEVEKLEDGTSLKLQRFITNLVPKCLSDGLAEIHMLPPVAPLSLTVLYHDETLQVDSEDMESAFNLFSNAQAWRELLAFAKKGSQKGL